MSPQITIGESSFGRKRNPRLSMAVHGQIFVNICWKVAIRFTYFRKSLRKNYD